MGVAEVDTNAKAAGKATRTIEFSRRRHALGLSRPGSQLPNRGVLRRGTSVDRSLAGLQGVGMLNTTILPEKPTNLTETDQFEIDPVVNGKLILSSSPGGYLRCR